MSRIKGFRVRRKQNDNTLPAAYEDADAQKRVLAKVRAMGEGFFTMSEDQFGDWLDLLPRNEFIELVCLT